MKIQLNTYVDLLKNLNHLFNKKDIQLWGMNLPAHENEILNLEKSLKVKNTSKREKIGEKRWNEFRTGRLCAIQGASELSRPIEWLEKKESGAPDWPSSLRGSISHSKSYAIAAVCKSSQYKSIGCDIEEVVTDKRIEVIKGMALNEEEQELINSDDLKELGPRKIATLLFSAKESLYKLVNPLTDTYLGFNEGIIRNINLENSTFNIELRSAKAEYVNYNFIFEGHFSIFDENVLTLLVLKNDK